MEKIEVWSSAYYFWQDVLRSEVYSDEKVSSAQMVPAWWGPGSVWYVCLTAFLAFYFWHHCWVTGILKAIMFMWPVFVGNCQYIFSASNNWLPCWLAAEVILSNRLVKCLGVVSLVCKVGSVRDWAVMVTMAATRSSLCICMKLHRIMAAQMKLWSTVIHCFCMVFLK